MQALFDMFVLWRDCRLCLNSVEGEMEQAGGSYLWKTTAWGHSLHCILSNTHTHEHTKMNTLQHRLAGSVLTICFGQQEPSTLHRWCMVSGCYLPPHPAVTSSALHHRGTRGLHSSTNCYTLHNRHSLLGLELKTITHDGCMLWIASNLKQ